MIKILEILNNNGRDVVVVLKTSYNNQLDTINLDQIKIRS